MAGVNYFGGFTTQRFGDDPRPEQRREPAPMPLLPQPQFLPQHLLDRYDLTQDVDTYCTLRLFREVPGARVLEVGCHDAPTPVILAEAGYQVVGVDLRESDLNGTHPNFTYVRGDFCDLPAGVQAGMLGTFDAVLAVSSLEHFGLGTYIEGRRHPYYDVLAARTIWGMLRDGGTAYVTVPAASKFWTNGYHWRVYSPKALRRRVVQDFHVEASLYVVSGRGVLLKGAELPVGSILSAKTLAEANPDSPHVSAVLKLRKVAFSRISPEGR